MDELAKSGRLKNSMTVKEQRGRKVAENMMLAELDKKGDMGNENYMPGSIPNRTGCLL